MVSVILPNHNEPNVDAFVGEIKTILPDAEIIVSNDHNGRGKGWAIREGLKRASGETVIFLDADGDIPSRMIKRLMPFIEDFDAVIGTKRICHNHLSRRILTLMSRLYVRMIFGIHADTQTGIKVFKRSVLKPWLADSYIFDVEILSQIDPNRIVEVPVEAVITRKMGFRSILCTLKDSLTLKFRLLSLRK